MNITVIGFLAMSFVGMTMLNRIAEGALVAAGEFTIINNITVFSSAKFLNLFSVPIINFNFFTQGLPHLIMWDYSYFGGLGAIFQYFLYSLTAAVTFGLFVIVISMLWSWSERFL